MPQALLTGLFLLKKMLAVSTQVAWSSATWRAEHILIPLFLRAFFQEREDRCVPYSLSMICGGRACRVARGAAVTLKIQKQRLSLIL